MGARLSAQDPDAEGHRAHRLRLAARRTMMEVDIHGSLNRVLARGARPRVQVQPGERPGRGG
eukprot:5455646-Pyramimonas_sp.AAC.1